MEVEEEKTSNHLHESATTVTNERLSENNSGNDKELEKEVSKSNTREEEAESSVTVPKLDYPKPSDAVTVLESVGAVAEEKEVIAECRNPELGGSGDSVVAESTNVMEDEKDGDEGAVKDEIPTGGVAAAECGGSELTNTGKDDGGEDNCVGSIVEEKVKNSGDDTDTNGLLVIGKVEDGCEGESEGEMETVKVEGEGGGGDVVVVPVADSGEREEVMEDAKDDTQKESIKIVQEDEAITEGQDDVQEGVVAEVVKQEVSVADEEETADFAENNEEEASLAAEEKPLGVAENDEEETSMADEEKVLGVRETAEEEVPVADEEKVDGATENDEETEEEATMADEEEVPDADIVMETELPVRKKGSAGKRKRGGKKSKATPKSKAVCKKMIDEDVCFICFDGGELVLCDHRDCPKAYHPSCVNRDEAFFKTKGRWNCGWHLCSNCAKKAEYMCYTCTFSLCKACIKTNDILCVREKEKKGFCETCMKTVMLIEKDSQGDQGNVDFDDKSSWEYLFKDYWTDLKTKLNLTLPELVEAKNTWKGSELSGKHESSATQSDVKDDGGSGSENPSEEPDPRKTRTRNTNKRKSATQSDVKDYAGSGSENSSEDPEPRKTRTRKTNKRKSDIKDDGGSGSENPSEDAEPRKTRRGKKNKRKSVAKEGNVNSSEETKNTEWASKELLEFVTHMRNGNKSIISQFDVQALLLEYIKTNNLRDSRRKSQIICDTRLQRLFGKPRVGHFEMLKLLESHFLIKEDAQIDDTQGSVVDTEVSQVDDEEANETPPKGGKDRKRKTRKKGDREPQSNREDYAAIDIQNISMIYLRRKLMEDLLDDTETFHSKVVGTFVRIRISGANHKQDIYRLVQVTGTTKAAQYTVGKKKTNIMLEILNLDKTESVSIDTISNQEFTEDECKRLRQSIKCGLINRLTVGDILDKAMELQAARVNDWLETEVMRLSHLRDRASDLGRKKELRECVEKLQVLKTPEERARRLEEFPVINVDPTMDPSYESEDDSDTDDKKQDVYNSSAVSRFSMRRDYPSKESWSGTGSPRSSGKSYEFSRNLSNKSFLNKVEDATSAPLKPHNENLRDQGRDTIVQPPSILKKPSSANERKEIPETAPKVNESEKMWHYKDPSGKIQGPFSMVQLRKWSNNKYFPVDLKIWRKNEKENDGILLTDALEGRFTTSVEMANLPSPTPNPSVTGSGQVDPSSNEGLHSPTPSSAQVVAPPDNNMVQPFVGQSLLVGLHGWNPGAPQNPQPSPLSNMVGQQQIGFDHWVGVPNVVQNPAGNVMLPPPPPPQPNGTWAAMPPNQNMGLMGPSFQGNVNPTWALQAGSVPAPPAQGVSWLPAQGPMVSVNGNPNWVGPLGNLGGVAPAANHGPANTSTGWVPGPGNQGGPVVQGPGSGNTNVGWAPTGNSNQGWGSPGRRNRATWDESDKRSGFSGQKRNRGSGSGFGDNRRQWDNNRGSRHSPRR